MQCVKALVVHRPTGRGKGEPYVISHSVAEAAGSRGTGRKSNSCSAVQPGYSCTITSGGTGQPITGPVHLSPPPPVSSLPCHTHTFTACVQIMLMLDRDRLDRQISLILPFYSCHLVICCCGENASITFVLHYY